MSELEVEIAGADALTPRQWDQWREMAAANPALVSPYFRPEFTRVAASVSPRAAVAVLKRGGRVIGFFPHQRRGGSIQPLAAPFNDYHGVIAYPGEAPSLEETARALNASRFNVSSWIGPAEGGQERQTVMAVLPEEGFDAWYAERRTAFGKFFKDKERARRSLEAEHGPLRVEHGLRDPKLLDHLIGLKQSQYRRSGRHDVFACGWTQRLLHRLMAWEGEGFGASLATLHAGDRLAAVEFSMHAGGHYHFWFPTYVPELARCSPGILLSLDTMKLAAEEGYRTFDFGFTGEHYKKYFCNSALTVREAVIAPPGLSRGLSGALGGALGLAAQGRAQALQDSIRRRWTAIEACEVTTAGQVRGAILAAGAALNKLSERPA